MSMMILMNVLINLLCHDLHIYMQTKFFQQLILLALEIHGVLFRCHNQSISKTKQETKESKSLTLSNNDMIFLFLLFLDHNHHHDFDQ